MFGDGSGVGGDSGLEEVGKALWRRWDGQYWGLQRWQNRTHWRQDRMWAEICESPYMVAKVPERTAGEALMRMGFSLEGTVWDMVGQRNTSLEDFPKILLHNNSIHVHTPGSVLSTLYYLFSSSPILEVLLFSPFEQVRRLRQGEHKQLDQVHSASKRWSQGNSHWPNADCSSLSDSSPLCNEIPAFIEHQYNEEWPSKMSMNSPRGERGGRKVKSKKK